MHYYYSMSDRVETTITTKTQLVILNLNGFSYIQLKTENVFVSRLNLKTDARTK